MIYRDAPPALDEGRQAIAGLYRVEEAARVETLMAEAEVSHRQREAITERARDLVARIRADQQDEGGMDAFMTEYELSSEEGVVLMCLAEALLRIPDAETQDRLIRDKIGSANWQSHLGHSQSWFVNASTWGLMLSGRILRWEDHKDSGLGRAFARIVSRSGEPVIRQAIIQAMRILGRQFVMGRTIDEAMERAEKSEARGNRLSYDMLGEAARTQADADRYFDAYFNAVRSIGARAAAFDSPVTAPGLSVKLSALHPRYEWAQREQIMKQVAPRLLELAREAKDQGIGLTVDAEEADRLDLSLDVFGSVAAEPSLKGWEGLGLAVQAYQKRATAVIDWLAGLAAETGRQLPVRLVKGAYWDTEIKRAQERGLDGYPVFTRKAATDVSFIACAKLMLADENAFYPAFATHNALTLATILEIAGNRRSFEFQRLHGMGEALYGPDAAGVEATGIACRIYAPVGSHEDLLPYLVRRLLENGANTSFVNRIVDDGLPVDDLVRSPVRELRRLKSLPHPRIPLPEDLYAPRRNAEGIDLSDPLSLATLDAALDDAKAGTWSAEPITTADVSPGDAQPVVSPDALKRKVGAVRTATADDVSKVADAAFEAQDAWDRLGGSRRAEILEAAAALLESRMAAFMALCIREAGKTVPDALADVREAIDFCRYYAAGARKDFSAPVTMPGPTGEANEMSLHGRGVFAVISPWNFPLAIFTGMTTAALAAGNSVIAKPAEQTPLTAAAMVRLLHEAGVPAGVIHMLPGSGETVGAALTGHAKIAGVAFTGSTQTAHLINRTLADREGAIPVLIAETGGQNALIADSSALTEQVIEDTVMSAFNSAGQRCSATRVLYIQDDVADRTIRMLAGAMEALVIGDPGLLATDVGPVIDADAKATLDAHIDRMKTDGRLINATPLPSDLPDGHFVAPHAFEIDRLSLLDREVFGPILHVIRYKADDLDAVIDAINATGYGLTLGVHSRIEQTVQQVISRARVGNMYVNRNTIGAIVGSQPFGGEGLSGTGPKAGGPHYLHRFATERVVSTDTTASGGNAALMSMGG